MTVNILRMADAEKQSLAERDLVKGRATLKESPILSLVVEAYDGPPGTKCTHGVYMPYGDKVALYCTVCNPYVLDVPEKLQKFMLPVEVQEEDALLAAVESGQMSEEKALRRLEGPRLHLRGVQDLNRAYALHVAGQLPEDELWKSLIRFVEATTKSLSHDRATFLSIEDGITETALQVWQQLKDFDPRRSSFRTFVHVRAVSRIRDLLRRHRDGRGGFEHIQLSEEKAASPGLSAEHLLLFKEWMRHLDKTDREILLMLKDGLTQQEIGEALGITQQAVNGRLQRIRRQEKPPFLHI